MSFAVILTVIYVCGTRIVAGDKTIFEKRIDHNKDIAAKPMFKDFKVEGILEIGRGVCFPAKPYI